MVFMCEHSSVGTDSIQVRASRSSTKVMVSVGHGNMGGGLVKLLILQWFKMVYIVIRARPETLSDE